MLWWWLSRAHFNSFSFVCPACPACLGPAFFHGSNVANGGVPVYAIVREYQDAWKTVDVVYHTFYPYNRGKLVCIGILNYLVNSLIVHWILTIKFNSPTGITTGKDKENCLGNVESFGNHVGTSFLKYSIIWKCNSTWKSISGDWEHVTLRFQVTYLKS